MSSVYRTIAAHEAFGKCPSVGHFDLQAVYLLSSDSCPEQATAEAMRRADRGDHIDGKRAKEIIAEHVSEDARGGKRRSRTPRSRRIPRPCPTASVLRVRPRPIRRQGKTRKPQCRDEAAAAEGYAPTRRPGGRHQ